VPRSLRIEKRITNEREIKKMREREVVVVVRGDERKIRE
jgi:hypothetical protein